jgi:allantoin racemase
MRMLLVNVNTTSSMTETMAASARRHALPDTEIVALTPSFGAEGVDTQMESLLSAVAVMDAVVTYPDPFDAVILGGFGEHGREGLQELTEGPVLDIAECSAHVALMLGRSYSVVTTMQRSVGAIEDRLLTAGLFDRCASVRSTGMATLELESDPERAFAAIVDQARRAVQDDHAEVLCLGCGGMAGLDEAVADATGVPVVDGIAAAVTLGEALVRMGMKTSKICTYAAPEPKRISGWPLMKAPDAG